jgi:hypothetical protein
MFKNSGSLSVDSLCLLSVVVGYLYTKFNSLVFFSGINPQIIPTQPLSMNKLSSAQTTNKPSVSSNLYAVSTGPIRAITKYLNIYY